jgi:hypothetical protein
MFFSRKPTGFILIERNKLALYPRAKSDPLVLGDDLVRCLEVKDAAKLTAAVREFAQKNNLRGQRLLIMLDKGVVFQKAVSLQPNADPTINKTDFESKIPFDPADRQALSMVQKDRQFLFGVNQSFCHLVVDALAAAGAKVTAVTPAVVYGVTDPDKLNRIKLEQIAQATSLTHSADFIENA